MRTAPMRIDRQSALVRSFLGLHPIEWDQNPTASECLRVPAKDSKAANVVRAKVSAFVRYHPELGIEVRSRFNPMLKTVTLWAEKR